MLETGGFNLLDTFRHNFQVPNKEDTEDFILLDLNTTPFLNTTGMLR